MQRERAFLRVIYQGVDQGLEKPAGAESGPKKVGVGASGRTGLHPARRELGKFPDLWAGGQLTRKPAGAGVGHGATDATPKVWGPDQEY